MALRLGSMFDYVYQYKDHLGNVRLSYQDINNNGSVDNSEIKEENNYYPFGLKHKGYNNVVNGRDHKYGYNGKEEQDELGLDMIDYGARNYDASLGRWMNLDPLADKYYSISPYVYVANTPIMAIDPDGKRIIFVPGLGYEAGSKDNPYANNITHAMVGYTAKYGTTSQTVDGSHGLLGDILHVFNHSRRAVSTRRIKKGTRIHDVASGIAQNLINNPLEDGEQMNIVAFSQGSVTTSQAVVDIFRDISKYGLSDDFKIDNLVLGGSPVSKDSKLFKSLLELQEQGKIGNIIYDDAQLEGDMVTGMGGTNVFQGIARGFKFLFNMISGKKRAEDPHAQAAQDKNGKTTKFVIKTLEENEVH
jgi:RHS repeat-associated protein